MSIYAKLVSNEDSVVPLVKIKNGGQTIQPIQRALTDNDIRHNQNLDEFNHAVDLDQPISISSRLLSSEKWKELQKRSGFESAVNSLHIQRESSPAGLKLFYPLSNVAYEVSETEQELLTSACVQAGFDAVPIMDNADSNITAFKSNLKTFSTSIEAHGRLPIPTVQMSELKGSESFKEKIDIVLDFGYPIVYVPYRGLRKNMHDYLFLKEKAKTSDCCFTIVNSDREQFGVSMSTLLPLYGASIVSIAMPRPFPRENSKEDFSIATRKWLDRAEMYYPNLLKSIETDSDFCKKDCKSIGLTTPQKLIEKKCHAVTLNSASRIFDTCITGKEYEILRNMSSKGEGEIYFTNKPRVDKVLESLS